MDGNSRYCFLDPYVGGALAVVEAARTLACVGARPLAATDCLNFGNPERPEIMGQFVGAVQVLVVTHSPQVAVASSQPSTAAGTSNPSSANSATARLAAIVASSADAIVGKTLDGVGMSWNAAAERLYGYSSAEMVGQSVERIVPVSQRTRPPPVLPCSR